MQKGPRSVPAAMSHSGEQTSPAFPLEADAVDMDSEVRERRSGAPENVIVVVGDLHREVEVLRRDIDVVEDIESADIVASRHVLDARKVVGFLSAELDRVVRLQVADDHAVVVIGSARAVGIVEDKLNADQ